MIEIAVPILIVSALVTGGLALWRQAYGPTATPRRLALRAIPLSLASALLVSTSVWRLSNSRTFQLFGGIVSRVSTSAPVVALTLDDGPSPQFTEEVLSLLEEQGIRATFYVTGEAVEGNMVAAQRIIQAGHEMGNHSYSHPRMIFKPYSSVQKEIERTDLLIRAAGYEGNIHFRCPYSKKLIVLPYYLQRTGRLNISFDVVPESYGEIGSDAHRIVDHVLDRARPGSIILLHVMAEGRAESRKAIPGIVQGLRERGYRFVTVSELLATQ